MGSVPSTQRTEAVEKEGSLPARWMAFSNLRSHARHDYQRSWFHDLCKVSQGLRVKGASMMSSTIARELMRELRDVAAELVLCSTWLAFLSTARDAISQLRDQRAIGHLRGHVEPETENEIIGLDADEYRAAVSYLRDALKRERSIKRLDARIGSRRACEVCGYTLKSGPNVCGPCRFRLRSLEGVDPLQRKLWEP